MVDANYQLHIGADRVSLADHLAGELAAQVSNAIKARGLAVIALSGGSTPKPLFEALAHHEIDWSKLVITLVDERWVSEEHELSNARFIKQYLLSALPETVGFVPLYQAASTVEESCSLVLEDYSNVTESNCLTPRPFDAVVLGMGGDGHTASFFPDAQNIDELLDTNSKEVLLTCESPSTQVERITWSLPRLLDTKFLALHITGADKKEVFERATNKGPKRDLPIRSALFQDRITMNVYYAD